MTVNRFGADRLDETDRGRLERLRGQRQLSEYEQGALIGLSMSGGERDRQAMIQQQVTQRTTRPQPSTPAAAGGDELPATRADLRKLIADEVQKGVDQVLRDLRDVD